MQKPKGCTYPDCSSCQLSDCEFDYDMPEIDTIGPLCPAEKKQQYLKQYRKEHADYFKAYGKRYHAEHKNDAEYLEKRRASSKRWAAQNKERIAQKSKERYYRKKNGEQLT